MKQFTMMLLAFTLMVSHSVKGRCEGTYPYLTFVTNSGETTVSVTSLKMNVSGTTLSVTNDEVSTTFNLADLTKMYFSTSSTGISSTTATADEATEVFTIDGVSLGKYASKSAAIKELKKGVYVLKSKTKTIKIAVQ